VLKLTRRQPENLFGIINCDYNTATKEDERGLAKSIFYASPFNSVRIENIFAIASASIVRFFNRSLRNGFYLVSMSSNKD